MRTIRSIRRRLDPAARSEYLVLIEALAALFRKDRRLKGFYVMESAASPGTFWEFLEFADREDAEDFRAAPTGLGDWSAVTSRIERLAGSTVLEDTLWDQRQ